MMEEGELVVGEIADVDARPQSPDGVDETARDEDPVKACQTCPRLRWRNSSTAT